MFGTGNWLVIIVLGGLAGGLAKLLMPGRDPGGCIITILLNIVVGIVGAFLAGLIFGGGINDTITVTTFLTSLVGAVILLAIVNLIRRGSVR